MYSTGNSLVQLESSQLEDTDYRLLKDLTLDVANRQAPQKVLETVIFNESQRHLNKAKKPLPSESSQSSLRRSGKATLNSSRKSSVARSVGRQKAKENKRGKPPRPSSSKRVAFNIKSIPNLNCEVKKIANIFMKHAKGCPQMKADLLKEGGSLILHEYFKCQQS